MPGRATDEIAASAKLRLAPLSGAAGLKRADRRRPSA